MKLHLRLATVAVLLPFTLTAQTVAPDWTTLGDAWWAHVQYLASDELQGRKPGTPGFDSAVAYVQKQFLAIGLKPAGSNGYLQPMPLDQVSVDAEKSSVTLSNGTTLDLAKDIT